MLFVRFQFDFWFQVCFHACDIIQDHYLLNENFSLERDVYNAYAYVRF